MYHGGRLRHADHSQVTYERYTAVTKNGCSTAFLHVHSHGRGISNQGNVKRMLFKDVLILFSMRFSIYHDFYWRKMNIYVHVHCNSLKMQNRYHWRIYCSNRSVGREISGSLFKIDAWVLCTLPKRVPHTLMVICFNILKTISLWFTSN